MGPPGAGKGTQAVGIAKRLGIPHISTGELFRQQMAAGTSLGAEVADYIHRGEYVPDRITTSMLFLRLQQADCAPGFLLDGYPRTLSQITALDGMLTSHGQSIDVVVELTVNTEQLIARLSKRAQEQGRADDGEEVIRRRMEVYGEQTAPLTALYQSRGVLVEVDGLGSVDDVSERIFTALDS